MLRRWGLMARTFVLFALVFVITSCGDSGSDPSPSFTLTLEATEVTSDSVTLSILANFNGSVPLWRNGYYYDDVSLQSGIPSLYIDPYVVSLNQYCYQAGGYGLLIGEIWSNMVCVIP